MKMKGKFPVLFFSVLAFSLMVAGCGGKYSDAKKLNAEYVELVQVYMEDLDKADNAKAVAKAINRFADGMEGLWPKMQKLSEKYPELKDKKNPPEELQESQKAAQEMGVKMMGSMMKLMPYMNDPEVRKAQKRLQEAMGKK